MPNFRTTVTLFLPQQCEDGLVPHIVHSLRKCIETSLPTAPKDIKLKRFVAQSYIGLFLEEDAAAWFRELMKNFAAETKRQGEQCVGVWVCGE